MSSTSVFNLTTTTPNSSGIPPEDYYGLGGFAGNAAVAAIGLLGNALLLCTACACPKLHSFSPSTRVALALLGVFDSMMTLWWPLTGITFWNLVQLPHLSGSTLAQICKAKLYFYYVLWHSCVYLLVWFNFLAHLELTAFEHLSTKSKRKKLVRASGVGGALIIATWAVLGVGLVLFTTNRGRRVGPVFPYQYNYCTTTSELAIVVDWVLPATAAYLPALLLLCCVLVGAVNYRRQGDSDDTSNSIELIDPNKNTTVRTSMGYVSSKTKHMLVEKGMLRTNMYSKGLPGAVLGMTVTHTILFLPYVVAQILQALGKLSIESELDHSTLKSIIYSVTLLLQVSVSMKGYVLLFCSICKGSDPDDV